jgi:hypothetical protein
MESELITKFKINWDKKSYTGYSDNYKFIEYIRSFHKIIAEGIGTPKSSRRQNKILLKPFLLNKFEITYLLEK